MTETIPSRVGPTPLPAQHCQSLKVALIPGKPSGESPRVRDSQSGSYPRYACEDGAL